MSSAQGISKLKDVATTGLTHECGVFGAIGSEAWSRNMDVSQIIVIGLEALQHRYLLYICLIIIKVNEL